MSYKELLERFNKLDINLWQVVVAQEVRFTFGLNEDYELICGFVYEYYLQNDNFDVTTICIALCRAMQNDDITIEMIRDDSEMLDGILETYLEEYDYYGA